MKRPSLSPATRIFAWTSFFNDVSSEMIKPIFPVFFITILHGSNALFGLMEGLAEFLLAVFQPLSGYLSDKYGKSKEIIISGYGLSSLMKLLYVLATSWPLVFFARIIERLGKAIRVPSRDAYLVMAEDKRNLAYAIGYRKMMDSFGAIVGPIITGAILLFYPAESIYYTILLLALIPAGLGVILLFFLPRIEMKPVKKPVASIDKKGKEIIKHLAIFSVFVISVPMLILKATIEFNVVFATAMYFLYNLAYAFSATKASTFLARFEEKKGLAFLAFFYAITMIFASIPVLLPLAFISLGIFYAGYKTYPRFLISQEKAKATAYGIMESAQNVGKLIANTFTGYTVATTFLFFNLPFVVLAIFALAYAFYFYNSR